MLLRNMNLKYMSAEATGGTPPAAAPASNAPAEATPPVAPAASPDAVAEPVADKPTGKPTETPTDTPVEVANKPKIEGTEAQQVHALVKDAGLNPTEVSKYLGENEGKISPAMLVELQAKYGDSVATMLAGQLEGIYTKQVEAAAAKDKVVFDFVAEQFAGVTEQSGEETWKELAGWAKTNIENDTRKELNALISQGGLAARLAVQELTVAFKGQPAQQQDADLVPADNFANTGKTQAIDKAGYNRELNKLLNAGHSYESSPEIAQLQRRRQKGLNSGI